MILQFVDRLTNGHTLVVVKSLPWLKRTWMSLGDFTGQQFWTTSLLENDSMLREGDCQGHVPQQGGGCVDISLRPDDNVIAGFMNCSELFHHWKCSDIYI